MNLQNKSFKYFYLYPSLQQSTFINYRILLESAGCGGFKICMQKLFKKKMGKQVLRKSRLMLGIINKSENNRRKEKSNIFLRTKKKIKPQIKKTKLDAKSMKQNELIFFV